MNDKPEGYPYPDKVRFEINQNKLTDYSVASQFLNINHTDIVCVQHEYGLFGGPAGSHLLKLLGDLRIAGGDDAAYDSEGSCSRISGGDVQVVRSFR